MSKFLVAGILSLLLTTGDALTAHAAAVLPTLPQKQVDVTMPTVNGSTLNATCGTLQAQLNAAAALDVNKTHEIILATGTTCVGPYKLPSHTGGTGWILIKGPNYASLPPSGTRVSPSDAALMPTIMYGDDGNAYTGAIDAQTGAQRYRIIGINIVQDSTKNPNWGLVVMGYNNQWALNTGYIILDRVVMMDTDMNHLTYRGVYGDAELGNTAMIDSYMSGIKGGTVGSGYDSQAWLSVSNPGPILIQNNFLEAAGENIMFCGGAPVSEAVMPRDATIRLNTLTKNPNWWGQPTTPAGLTVKTLLELKCGQRVLIDGNDFRDMPWNDGGNAFRLTVRSENLGTGYMDVSDLTITNNLGKNVTNWINSFGSDDGGNGPGIMSKHSKRWNISNNLVYGLGWSCMPGNGCDGHFYTIQSGGGVSNCTDPTPTCQNEDITISHNTVDDVGSNIMQAQNPGAVGLNFRDNLINSNGSYGIFGGMATGVTLFGTNFLNLVWPGPTWTFVNNRIAGISGNSLPSSSYPQGTNAYPADVSSFLFTNRAARDYTLQPTSPAKNAASDGTDQGVNFAAYNAARSGSTVSPAPTPDTTAPSTPTNLTATAISSSQINLSWTASTDNVGVTGYRIYRNGTQIATTATNSYSNTALTPSTAYSYTVSAYDTSNNASTQSSSASATTQAPPVVATTPVGSWSFDTADLTTTTTLDRSGLNHTLTLINTPARVTGKVNQALSFDGISSTASCTDAACGGTTKLDMGTSDWTTSAWVKTSPAATGNIVTKSGFICGGNPDGWTVYVSSTGKLQAALHDSVAGCLFSANDGTTINDGTWHLTTTVFNRAGNLVRYVDGIQTGTATSIASLNGASIDSTSEFRIGSRDAAGDNGFLNGAIDEVKVYPRALSLTEIQALYAAGTSVSPTPDTTAPSTPTNLTATAISTTQINLSWTASTDNVGVSGYRIYRSGTQIATTATNSYSNTGLSANTAYTYTIAAYDAAGNTSVQSAGASATTQSASVTTTTTTTNTSPTNTTTSTNTSTANTSTNTTSPAGGSSGGVGSSVTTPATSSTYTPSSSQTTSTTPVTPSLSLTRTLYQGAKGTDVKNLQTFLVQNNYLATTPTGFYGPLTTQAVQKYQCAQNIVCSGTQTSTGYGMVGLKTRAKLNGSSSSYVSTSNLTPAQADAIIALIQSFGADAAVVARVKVVLGR